MFFTDRHPIANDWGWGVGGWGGVEERGGGGGSNYVLVWVYCTSMYAVFCIVPRRVYLCYLVKAVQKLSFLSISGIDGICYDHVGSAHICIYSFICHITTDTCKPQSLWKDMTTPYSNHQITEDCGRDGVVIHDISRRIAGWIVHD